MYTLTIFELALAVSAAIYALMAVLCLRVNTPADALYRSLRLGRTMLALAYFAIAADLAVSALLRYSGLDSRLDYADMACFPIAAVFMVQFVFLMLDPAYRVRRYLRSGLCIAAVQWALLALSLLFPRHGEALAVASIAIFATYALLAGTRFHIALVRARQTVDNSVSGGLSRYLLWLRRSCILMLGFAAASTASFLLPQPADAVALAYVVLTGIYLYTSFQKYLINYPGITHALIANAGVSSERDVAAEEATPLNDHQLAALSEWESGEGYREVGITVMALAEKIGCNRFYLSRHINMTTGKSFSDWVNMHRLAYAKRLMLASPLLPMGEVAWRAGFSSAAYFSQVFSRSEGVPPLRWRKRNAPCREENACREEKPCREERKEKA